MEMLSISRDGRQVAVLVLVRPSPDAPAAPHAVLGEADFEGGEPDWGTFRRNRSFVEFFTRYMRGELPIRPDILAEARVKPGDYIYIIDPRVRDPQGEVPFHDIVGWYESGADGSPRRETFMYNSEHLLVVGDGVASGLAQERKLVQAALVYTLAE